MASNSSTSADTLLDLCRLCGFERDIDYRPVRCPVGVVITEEGWAKLEPLRNDDPRAVMQS